MEKCEDLLGLRIAHTVEDRLRLLPRRDEPLVPQLGEVLGQSRLPQTNAILKLSNGQFALSYEMAKHQ